MEIEEKIKRVESLIFDLQASDRYLLSTCQELNNRSKEVHTIARETCHQVKILENTVSKELEIIDLKNDAKVSGLWWQVASFTAPLAIFEFVFHFNDIDFGAIKNLIRWFN